MSSLPGKQRNRMTLAEAEAMGRRDRRRILLLAIAVVVLGAGYFGTRMMSSADDAEDQGFPMGGDEGPDGPQILTLPFDDDELLAQISDGSPETRLIPSTEPLEGLLKYSVTLQARNYEALGIREVDAAVAEELASDPASHRVEALRLRGRLARLVTHKSDDPAIGERHMGSIELEGGGWGHFACLRPVEMAVDDYVRLDGVFAQILRAEAAGEMREGPLVAGRELMRSYEVLPAPTQEELWMQLLREVTDDELKQQSGIPHEAQWALMAFAAERAEEIDWDEAPEVNSDLLNTIAQGGDFFRGKPMRLPICGNLGAWTEEAGENPLRLERVTRGWIGNNTWRGSTGVIQYLGPFDKPELADHDGEARFVVARGFFLKTVFYERVDGRPGRAPFFVMSSVEAFDPPLDPTTRQILWGVLVGTVVMIVLIFWLLRRDARSSKELQAELVRRRRARRDRQAAAEAGESPPQDS